MITFGGRMHVNNVIGGSINVNGIKIDLDDPIGTCKRILALVPEEDQIDFAKEILAEASNLTSEHKEQKKQNTAIVKDVRLYPNFNGIDVKGSFNVVFTTGDETSVTIEGKKKDVDNIITENRNGTLYIKQDKVVANPKALRVIVQAPELNKIKTSGTCDVTVKNPLTVEGDFEINTTGSGDVDIPSLNCDSLYVETTASSDVTIAHLESATLDAGVTGSGDVNFEDAKIADTARFNVQGSGDIRIYGSVKRLRASVMGSGDIRGTITCDHVNASVMGSGDINLNGRIKSHTKSIMGSGDINIG